MTKSTKKNTLRGDKAQFKAVSMFLAGKSVRAIAEHFGVSYEWTRRVVTGIRYSY
jgi:transposase